jgi:tetratricopeptide (TPR) repeat protein
MITTRILLAAAFVSICVSPAGAQVRPAPVPPVPPAAPVRIVPPVPPAPPAAPVPPAPFVFTDIDVPHFAPFDHGTLDEITQNAREIAESMREFRAFELAQAIPTPAPPPPPGAIGQIVSFFGNSGDSQYDRGRGYIDRSQYDRAVDAFNQVISGRGDRADAAMYWRAYSLNKLARRPEALAGLSELQKQFPKSPWVDDARRLDAEIRQSSGQAVSADSIDDEDMRLLVLQGLMQNDPEAALPQIEKMIAGPGSVRLKERALFVASRSRSPRGRQVITAAAKGSANPDLQMSAIQYLGRMSGAESAQALEEIYRASNSADVKKRILQALASANANDRLGPIARTEKDPELKRMAIRQLGVSRQADVGETLAAIYNGDSAIETRKAVIDALAQNSRNAASVRSLIALSRAEKNKELQTIMVQRLSNVKSPEVTAYMLELLK